MMAALLNPRVMLSFQNTGREHEKTLEFLAQLDDALNRPVGIAWLEFRKPKKKGAPPREFQYAVVTYKTAARRGEPFSDMMEALAEYRETKGLPPITPWARGRLCTGYLKHKVAERYAADVGLEDYDSFVGLRHDEPDRVARLKDRETKTHGFRCALDDAKITKPDVLEFWGMQPFNLELKEHEGNCTNCFLKDQGDLARLLVDPQTDPEWWFAIQEKYAGFGGLRFPAYRQLAEELPTRLEIEAALREERDPPTESAIVPKHRLKLLVRQERARLKGETAGFSCACEASMVNDPDEIVEGTA